MMGKQFLFLLAMLSTSIAVAQQRTPTPEIYVNEGEYEYVIEVLGQGEIHLFKFGEEVENYYVIEKTSEDQYFYFEAYAQAVGCLPSEIVGLDVYVPPLEPEIEPPLPDFDLIVTDEYVYVEFHGLEYFSVSGVYVNGLALGTPYVLPRWEEDYLVEIYVEFSWYGYNTVTVRREYVVPALEGAPHDVNSDGRVSIDDVTALIQYLLTLNTEGFNVEKADVDGSGFISIDDVTELINRLLNMPPW